ncbi:MAG: hypothetical protein H6910_06000 [Rickettsiaceae bacterium]|nr:hypothetical protein [Rickettsiaceae bacterium]MCP5378650.1 hypothetical protein [Rickettsiaceae bacterium]
MLRIKRPAAEEEYYELDKEKPLAETTPNKTKIERPFSNKKIKIVPTQTSIYKDYNLKELYQADPDLYKAVFNVISNMAIAQFNLKVYSSSTEDLQKDTIASTCRIYFADNKIVGYAVLYVREKRVEINEDSELCYVARGSSVIFEDFRGKTQAVGFSIQYLADFIDHHKDKPTFLFSESVSPLTLYMITKYMDGYVGLPSTLIEVRANNDRQIIDYLEQLSNKSLFDLSKVCDSITRTIEPEQAELYNKSGRIAFPSAFFEKVKAHADNYKKTISFKLFENSEYYYTEGYAIPTVVLIDHNTITIQHYMLKLAEAFSQSSKPAATVSSFSNLFCCNDNLKEKIEYDDIVKNNEILSFINHSTRRNSLDSVIGRLEDYVSTENLYPDEYKDLETAGDHALASDSSVL